MAFVAAALLDLDPSRLMRRTAIAEKLWENAATRAANGNLRQLIKRVRSWQVRAGVTLIEADEHSIWRSDRTIPSDLGRLLTIKTVVDAQGLTELADLYGGDFLADAADVGEETQQWIREQRTALRERFLKVARDAAMRFDGAVSTQLLDTLSELAPYDDDIARARMIKAGRRSATAGVRAEYNAFSDRLLRDLDDSPAPETDALLHELVAADNAATFAAPASAMVERAHSGAAVPSLLILPPGDSMGFLSRAEQLLGQSLIDEVTHSLSRMRTFAVFAPHTARQIAVQPFPDGQAYGADYVLNTRLVPGSNATVRLTATLTSVGNHRILLSEEMRFKPEELGAHHYHLATALSVKLASGIEQAEMLHYQSSHEGSTYVHYLLGLEYMKTVELQPVRRALRHFRHAIKLSPHFAPAKAQLSRASCFEWLLLERNGVEPVLAARELAREALSDDPLDPMAHRELGNAELYLDRFDEAAEAMDAAVRLGPHHADVLINHADVLMHIGNWEDAKRSVDQAMQLNPLAPDFYHWVSASVDYFRGKYADASTSLKRLDQPEAAARVIAAVEARNGNFEEAKRQRKVFMERHPDFRLTDYKIPMRDRNAWNHYLDGLRLAGFT
jgi:DNA-binding SARP family transcriptional activator